MASELWLLHDVSRRLAVRWDRRELTWLDPDDLPPDQPALAEDEAAYQTLWQTYFRTIAVRERRNPRLQRRCMPARYWTWLVERPARSVTGSDDATVLTGEGGGEREGRAQGKGRHGKH
jgi:probable DNA metabolism protein